MNSVQIFILSGLLLAGNLYGGGGAEEVRKRFELLKLKQECDNRIEEVSEEFNKTHIILPHYVASYIYDNQNRSNIDNIDSHIGDCP